MLLLRLLQSVVVSSKFKILTLTALHTMTSPIRCHTTLSLCFTQCIAWFVLDEYESVLLLTFAQERLSEIMSDLVTGDPVVRSDPPLHHIGHCIAYLREVST